MEYIDIIIPCHSKDSDTLPICLESVRDFVEDKIDKIFVVAPNDDTIKKICLEFDCIFVEETEYMGFSKDDLLEIREDKRGWLFQQLIKLKGNIGTHENYLVLDADVMFLKPYRFLNEDSTPNFIMNSYLVFKEYLDVNEKLTGIKTPRRFTFITDKMLFNINIIKEVHNKIKEHTGESDWIQAIIKNYDNNSEFGFSEFELYGLIYGNRPHTKLYPIEKHINKKQLRPYKQIKNNFYKASSVTFYS